jgi:hypoxanthine phosphoribosyltransferase
MGFGTTLYTGIYFHDENYDNIVDVQNRINEVKAIINNYKERMKMYAVCTEPKKFFEDEKDIFLAIHNRIDEYFEILEEYYTELYKLELLLDKWEPSVVVCDYIAGMTDNYCVKLFNDLFMPTK